MKFSYSDYKELIGKLIGAGYKLINPYYFNLHKKGQALISHDVDLDLDLAFKFSLYETHAIGIRSIYFVQVSSEFYNVMSRMNKAFLQKISQNHQIGLHFDIFAYQKKQQHSVEWLSDQIAIERDILQDIIQDQVIFMNWHRVGLFKKAPVVFANIIDYVYRENYKNISYFSDSLGLWRNPLSKFDFKCLENIKICTHPFWYDCAEPVALHNLQNAMKHKIKKMRENISEQIIGKGA